jgi:type VI secretion system secreted protein VgrG
MTADLRVTFECDAFDPVDVDVYEVSGVEECSQIFNFHIVLVTRERSAVDTDTLVTGPGSLVFYRRDEEVRRIRGMVASLHDVTLTDAMEFAAWRVHFVPRAFRLTLSETVDIFMDLDVRELIELKLKGNGLRAGTDVEFRLTKKYPKREFVVQYQETDLNFISRQAEHYGITYFFQHGEKDKIVFTDCNEVLDPIEGTSLPWQIHHVNELSESRVFALEGETRALPGRYTVRDYNYRTPGQDMTAGATVVEGAAGEVVEYGTHFKTSEEGQRFARVRAEELLATRWTFTGKSNAWGLEAGRHFMLEGHPRGDMGLLLTRIEHFIRYENTFIAIPKEVTWRPPRRTVKPIVPGVVTGIIDTATRSQYAEIDDDGRYKVKFMFDTAKRGEGQASRLVRMAQPHAGPGYGMHFPLRAGIEVILTCVNGDPDRPIIVGTVPNPATGSPVTKGNLARNIIRTGGGNEMNFDDTEGSHRLKISIPHADTTLQLGSPNSPERGYMMATAEAASTVAGTVATQVSNISNIFAAHAKFLASTDITAYAGVSNKLDKWEAVPGLINAYSDFAKDAAGLHKQWSDIPAKWNAARAASLNRDVTARGVEVARANADRAHRLAAAQQSLDAANNAVSLAEARHNAALAAYPGNASDPNDPGYQAVIATGNDLASARAAQTNAQNHYNSENTATKEAVDEATKRETSAKDLLKNDPEQAKIVADSAAAAAANAEADYSTAGYIRRGTQVAADTVKNVTKGIKAGKDAIDKGKSLLSGAAKLAAKAAKSAAALKATGAVAAGSAYGGLSRVTGGIGALTKSWNIQAATGTTAILGMANAVMHSPNAVSVSGGRFAVLGSRKAVVHAFNAAELTGLARALITSNALIDAHSKARIKTKSGSSTTMHATGPMALTTKASMGIKATNKIKFTAGPLIHAKAANVKVQGTAKIDLKTTNFKLDASAAIKMKAGSKVEAKVGGSTVRVTSGHVTMAKGGTMAKVTGSNAMLKHGGTKLTLSGSGAKLSGPKAKISGSGGVKITGAKIDLG